MSVEAQVCAMRIKLPPGNSTAKHVLTILANHANGDPCVDGVVQAWPSIASLVDSTGQDRKTVITNLQKLQAWKLIEDSGYRTGRTGQVVVYNLHIAPDLLSEQFQNRDRLNGPKIGMVPKSEQFRIRKETVPNFRENSTDIGTRNHQELSGKDISGARDFEGTFEGHDDPPPAPAEPTPQGVIAVELIRRGYRITPQDPALLRAIAAGATLKHITDFADLYPAEHAKCRGSPGYILGAAYRQVTEPTDNSSQRASHGRASESAADRIRRVAEEAEQRDRAAVADRDAHVVGAHG